MAVLRALPGLALCLVTLLSLPARAGPDEDKRGYKRMRSAGDQEPRVALVIGNSRYKSAPLKNPVRDAKLMSESLKEVGFDVDVRFDLNRNEMLRAIREFGDALRQSGGVGLFFFAGHGMQVSGRSYLIPVRADIRVEADVELEAVDAQRVLARMEEANNRLNIVVLDACRNNPVGRSVRSRDNGLAFINAPSGTLISYATAPGRVAADGRGKHSYYTEALAKHLRTPGLRVEDVFKRVRSSVQKATRGEQTPWESSSLTGDFYFSGTADEAPVAAAPATAPRVASAAPAPAESSVVYERQSEQGGDADLSYQGGGTQPLDAPERRGDDDDTYRREGRYRDYEGVSALEAKLAFHRTVVNYTEWLGYLGWTTAVVGVIFSIYGVAGIIVPTLLAGTGAAGAVVLLVFGVPMFCGGLVAGAGLCGTAYLFRTFADGTIGDIKEKDPAWRDNGNDGCSPSMLF